MMRWRGGEGRERRGEERARRTARGRSRSPAACCCPSAIGAIATCATPNVFLKHSDETFTRYVRRQMKHLKHVSKTIAKKLKTLEKPLQNICNI
jgi:hypothetical protein